MLHYSNRHFSEPSLTFPTKHYIGMLYCLWISCFVIAQGKNFQVVQDMNIYFQTSFLSIEKMSYLYSLNVKRMFGIICEVLATDSNTC